MKIHLVDHPICCKQLWTFSTAITTHFSSKKKLKVVFL
ncbi:unnamed protein product, partial [Rotaria sp. Silwood1]